MNADRRRKLRCIVSQIEAIYAQEKAEFEVMTNDQQDSVKGMDCRAAIENLDNVIFYLDMLTAGPEETPRRRKAN